MKPPRFSYHAPDTVAEAVGLLASLENAKLLAGGQSLMPMLNMRYVLPDHVVDLNRVRELAYIREHVGRIEIGAMTRQRDIEFSELIQARCPILREALQHVGHRQTRNRGTLGGSLCHLDPSAELATVACALDATITITGPRGERSMPFADFPLAYMTPAIEPDEIVTSVAFDPWPAGHGHAFVEFARRHGDFAIASAAALLLLDRSGTIIRASMALGGVGTVPVRASVVEHAVVARPATAQLFREACESCRGVAAIDDVHAAAGYRQHLAVVMAERALTAAHARAAASI
jgi:carbon-monoxide dehydrogenase medium subunit